jgi:hypothetical protein
MDVHENYTARQIRVATATATRCVITAHGTKTGEWTRRFYVRFRDWKKKLRSFSAGTDLRAARSKKKRILGENEQGVDFDKGKVERFTFNLWADRYLELTATKRTAKDDRLLVKVLRPEFGTQASLRNGGWFVRISARR